MAGIYQRGALCLLSNIALFVFLVSLSQTEVRAEKVWDSGKINNYRRMYLALLGTYVQGHFTYTQCAHRQLYKWTYAHSYAFLPFLESLVTHLTWIPRQWMMLLLGPYKYGVT